MHYTGGIIYPIIFRRLQPQIGFPWTTRLIAFIMLATLVLPVILMRTRRKPSSQWKLFDLAAWRELPYLLFGSGLFCTFMGLYIPFFYVQTYVIQQKIMNEDLGFYLLAILNAGSFLGRIVCWHNHHPFVLRLLFAINPLSRISCDKNGG